MSNEMIERVAKVIDSYMEAYHDPCVIAKAAIKAMREPTEAMKLAWSRASLGIDLKDDRLWRDDDCATRDWQAMIDAALKE